MVKLQNKRINVDMAIDRTLNKYISSLSAAWICTAEILKNTLSIARGTTQR